MVKKKLYKKKKNVSKKTLGGGKKNIVSRKLSPRNKISKKLSPRKRFKIIKRKTEKKRYAKMKGGKKRSRTQRGGMDAGGPAGGQDADEDVMDLGEDVSAISWSDLFFNDYQTSTCQCGIHQGITDMDDFKPRGWDSGGVTSIRNFTPKGIVIGAYLSKLRDVLSTINNFPDKQLGFEELTDENIRILMNYELTALKFYFGTNDQRIEALRILITNIEQVIDLMFAPGSDNFNPRIIKKLKGIGFTHGNFVCPTSEKEGLPTDKLGILSGEHTMARTVVHLAKGVLNPVNNKYVVCPIQTTANKQDNLISLTTNRNFTKLFTFKRASGKNGHHFFDIKNKFDLVYLFWNCARDILRIKEIMENNNINVGNLVDDSLLSGIVSRQQQFETRIMGEVHALKLLSVIFDPTRQIIRGFNLETLYNSIQLIMQYLHHDERSYLAHNYEEVAQLYQCAKIIHDTFKKINNLIEQTGSTGLGATQIEKLSRYIIQQQAIISHLSTNTLDIEKPISENLQNLIQHSRARLNASAGNDPDGYVTPKLLAAALGSNTLAASAALGSNTLAAGLAATSSKQGSKGASGRLVSIKLQNEGSLTKTIGKKAGKVSGNKPKKSSRSGLKEGGDTPQDQATLLAELFDEPEQFWGAVENLPQKYGDRNKIRDMIAQLKRK